MIATRAAETEVADGAPAAAEPELVRTRRPQDEE
jgi:hypothetical protein